MTLRRHCGAVLGGNSFRESSAEKGMVLPFTPLVMSFSDVHYYVDVPAVSLCSLFIALFASYLFSDTFITNKYITVSPMGHLHRCKTVFPSSHCVDLLSLIPPSVSLPAKLLSELHLCQQTWEGAIRATPPDIKTESKINVASAHCMHSSMLSVHMRCLHLLL